MAKVTGPLLSIEAHGKFKQRLTYTHRKGVNIVRIQRANRYTRTSGQSTVRTNFLAAVAEWNVLTTDQKMVYNNRGKKLMLTGYNLFLHENIGAIPTVTSDILLENGGYLLLQSGGKIEL